MLIYLVSGSTQAMDFVFLPKSSMNNRSFAFPPRPSNHGGDVQIFVSISMTDQKSAYVDEP